MLETIVQSSPFPYCSTLLVVLCSHPFEFLSVNFSTPSNILLHTRGTGRCLLEQARAPIRRTSQFDYLKVDQEPAHVLPLLNDEFSLSGLLQRGLRRSEGFRQNSDDHDIVETVRAANALAFEFMATAGRSLDYSAMHAAVLLRLLTSLPRQLLIGAGPTQIS